VESFDWSEIMVEVRRVELWIKMYHPYSEKERHMSIWFGTNGAEPPL
jgi:hypothetical protein